MYDSFPSKKMEDPALGIYDDLDNTDLGTQIHNLQKTNDSLQKHIQYLEIQVVALKTTQETLKRNISELYNTAKAEISRKDLIIADLRRQLDDEFLRKNGRADSRKRPADDNRESVSKCSDNSSKHLKSDTKQIGDVRQEERKRSNSDDSRWKNDRRRDYQEKDRLGYNDHKNYRDSRRDSSRDRRSYKMNDHRNRDEYKNVDYLRYRRKQDDRRKDRNRENTSPLISTKEITSIKNENKEINLPKNNLLDIGDPVRNPMEDDSHSKEWRLSKIDLEAYVKLERMDKNNSHTKEVDCHISEMAVKDVSKTVSAKNLEKTIEKKLENNSKIVEITSKDIDYKSEFAESNVKIVGSSTNIVQSNSRFSEKSLNITENKSKIVDKKSKPIVEKNVDTLTEKLPETVVEKPVESTKIELKETIEDLTDGYNKMEVESLSTSGHELQVAINSIKEKSFQEQSFQGQSLETAVPNEISATTDENESYNNTISDSNTNIMNSNRKRSVRSRRRQWVVTIEN